MGSERREILSAEIFLDSFRSKVDTADIDAELECVNQELQAYCPLFGTVLFILL